MIIIKKIKVIAYKKDILYNKIRWYYGCNKYIS